MTLTHSRHHSHQRPTRTTSNVPAKAPAWSTQGADCNPDLEKLKPWISCQSHSSLQIPQEVVHRIHDYSLRKDWGLVDRSRPQPLDFGKGTLRFSCGVSVCTMVACCSAGIRIAWSFAAPARFKCSTVLPPGPQIHGPLVKEPVGDENVTYRYKLPRTLLGMACQPF